MLSFRLAAAGLLTGVLVMSSDAALAGKIQKSREKIENSARRSGSSGSSSSSSGKTSDSSDDDCGFLAFVFGLCGNTAPAAVEAGEPGDIRMEVSPTGVPQEHAAPPEGETVAPAAATDEPWKEERFAGKARIESSMAAAAANNGLSSVSISGLAMTAAAFSSAPRACRSAR